MYTSHQTSQTAGHFEREEFVAHYQSNLDPGTFNKFFGPLSENSVLPPLKRDPPPESPETSDFALEKRHDVEAIFDIRQMIEAVAVKAKTSKRTQEPLTTPISVCSLVEGSPPANSVNSEFIGACVEDLFQVLRIFGFVEWYKDPTTGSRRKYNLDATKAFWCHCAEQCGSPIKYVKYKIAAFYSFHNGQEIPPPPPGVDGDKPAILFTGIAGRYLHKMRLENPILWRSFLFSVLQVKKGMPRPNKALIKQAEVDAVKKLTVPAPDFSFIAGGGRTFVVHADPVIEERLAERRERGDYTMSKEEESGLRDHPLMPGLRLFRGRNVNQACLVREIGRTVRELFVGKSMSQEERVEPFFPSTSANYINSRKRGGAIGVLKDAGLTDDFAGKPMIKTREEELPSSTGEWHGADLPVDPMQPDVHLLPMSHAQLDVTGVQTNFDAFYKEVEIRARTEEPVAVPLGLAEALKVRVISKGPPFLYTYFKPVQKFLWSTLSRHPLFELIGTPVTPLILNKRIGRCGFGEVYTSVDYSDATNEMASWATEAVVEALQEFLPVRYYEDRAIYKALTEHIIEGKDGNLPQKRGQLMGSVLSFPILCIVNATILRLTEELLTGKKVSLRRLRAVVNGDDAVVRSKDNFRAMWELVARVCGFSASPGKVYVDPLMLNINSREFFWTQTLNLFGNGFVETPFVNMGILNGMKRSEGMKRDGDPVETYGSRATTLIQTAPEALRPALLCQFIKNNPFLTNGDGTGNKIAIPWFLPESLGGLGLPTIEGSQYRCGIQDYAYIPYTRQIRRPPLVTGGWMAWKLARRALETARREEIYCPSAGPCDVLKTMIRGDRELMKFYPSVQVPPATASVQTVTNHLVVHEFLTGSMTSLLEEAEPGENMYYWKLSDQWKLLRKRLPLKSHWHFEESRLGFAELCRRYDVDDPLLDDNNYRVYCKALPHGAWGDRVAVTDLS